MSFTDNYLVRSREYGSIMHTESLYNNMFRYSLLRTSKKSIPSQMNPQFVSCRPTWTLQLATRPGTRRRDSIDRYGQHPVRSQDQHQLGSSVAAAVFIFASTVFMFRYYSHSSYIFLLIILTIMAICCRLSCMNSSSHGVAIKGPHSHGGWNGWPQRH